MKKRFVSALLAVLMLVTLVPVTAMGETIVAEGYCGGDTTSKYDSSSRSYKNLTWTLDSEGLLTINGIGKMTDSNSSPWYNSRSNIKKVIIDSGVTTIGNNSFNECSNLISVTIPDTVTSIGRCAFYKCSSLTSVTIPDSVTNIGDYVFYGCSNLMSIAIPNGLNTISEAMFYECSSLTSITIPSSVTCIGDWAFVRCNSLTSVTIPNSVSTIGKCSFDECKSLTAVDIPVGVTSIGERAFASCSSLISVSIPKSVTSIGDGVFELCSNLTSVTIPAGVTSIGVWAFYYCRSLTSVSIPGSAATIGRGAFIHCNSLTSVLMAEGVAKIDDDAFSECTSLVSVTIPDSVTIIGDSAFGICDSLTEVYYTGTETQWKNISIGMYNSDLINATIHYNYYELSDEQQNVDISSDAYYTTPEMRLFRIHAVGSHYPCPAGFAVKVGTNTYTSGETTCFSTDDITAKVSTGYTGNVIISKEGFHTCSIPAELTGQYNTVGMMPISVMIPFAQMMLMRKGMANRNSFYNLVEENATIYELDVTGNHPAETNTFYPSVDWNGHGSGEIWLQQENVTVSLTNNSWNNICIPEKFVANKPVYICMKAADGTTSSQKLGFVITPRMSNNIKVDLGEAFTANTAEASGDNLSILAGESLKFDFKELSDSLIPINFTIKRDGTIEGVIGLQLAKESDTDAVFGSMKNSLDRWTKQDASDGQEIAKLLKEMKQYGTPMPNSSEFGISGSATVLGYFTGKIADGRVGFTETKIVLCFEGKLSYTYNTVIMEIPAYFKSGLKAKLEQCLKMAYDEQLQKLISDGTNHLDASLGLSAEVGPGWSGYLSGGVKGSGSVKMKGQIPLSVPSTSLSLQASFSFVGTLAGLEGEWTFYETPEKIFWDAGEFCWKDPATKKAAQNFMPNLQMTPMTMLGSPNAIATGVSGYTTPSLTQLSDGRLLAVWVASVPGRSAVDKNGVWYSIFDGSTWSQAQLVSDDGTNDSVPQLYNDNGTVYLAWQNYTTTFGTDELPDYDTLSAQMVAVAATFDESENTWGTPVQAEPDWYQSEPALPEDYEGEWPDSFGTRTVVTYGDNRAVLYLADDENECAQVFGLFHDGFNWGQPLQLTAVSGGIDGFSAVMDEDSVQILYTSGDYADAALSLTQVDMQADMAVTDVDYIRQTFVPGNDLTLVTTVKNESPVTVNGVHVRVLNGGAEVHSEDISVRFDSGEEDILYVNYALPETIDFSQLTVEVTPLNTEDANLSDNTGICALYSVDLSAENPAAQMCGDITKVLTQVVNRGRERTAATTLTLYKDTPDGEILATQEIPAMEPGELLNIVVELDTLAKDDMVYMAIAECGEENLIGNNTTQAVVLPENVKEYARGDINGDDIVDLTDLKLLSRHIAKIEPITNKAILAAADYNRDGDVNAVDLTALARYIKAQQVE